MLRLLGQLHPTKPLEPSRPSSSAATMLFSLLALLPALSSVTAVPVVDLSYRAVRERQGCVANTIFCNTPQTFSLCAPGGANGTREVFFGSVAPGTYCDQSQQRIRRNNNGNCQPDGRLKCGKGGNTFFVCDQGGLIDFGGVAAGTTCSNGTIVAI